MWPWRRRSQFESLNLPKKVFISHSYQDTEARDQLLELLPEGVEPTIFRPIVAPPEQMVSDWLLDVIESCDGLIYLKNGMSARSFWVALERDYARRRYKPVFAFDPEDVELQPDSSAPMDLPVYISYARADEKIAEQVIGHLHRRHFDVRRDEKMTIVPGVSVREDVEHAILERLAAGGYVISVVTPHAESGRVLAEQDFVHHFMPDRVLHLVCDDEVPEPFRYRAPENWIKAGKEGAHLDVHRIDDLIVRLYWLIYRNTRQNQLS